MKMKRYATYSKPVEFCAYKVVDLTIYLLEENS